MLGLISEQIEEFEKEAETLFGAIINLKRHRPLGSGRKFKPVTPAILMQDYTNFLKENKTRIEMLDATVKNLGDEIKILDAQTANLVRALSKSY